jgi:hypothetical protein
MADAEQGGRVPEATKESLARGAEAVKAAAATDDQIGSGTDTGWEGAAGAGFAGTVGVAPESDANAPEPMRARARASSRAADVGFMAGREGYDFLCLKDPRTGGRLLSMPESWNFRHSGNSPTEKPGLLHLNGQSIPLAVPVVDAPGGFRC